MTLLGYRNPARRIVGAVRGLVRRPRGSAKRRPVAGVGYRGAPREAPENTLDSFAKALDLGADAIETDVCVTRDGRFVLWHDNRPDDKVALFRQTGEEGYLYEPDVPAIGSPWRRPVNELDLEDLRRHYGYVRRKGGRRTGAAGPHRPSRQPARVDVLRIPPRAHLPRRQARRERDGRRPGAGAVRPGRAELGAHSRKGLGRAALPAAGDPAGAAQRVTAGNAGSRNHHLRGLRASRRARFREAVRGGLRQLRGQPPALGGVPRRARRVLAARDAGRIDSVIVWTINDEKRMRELVALNVDGILTDDARLLRRIVSERSPPA